MDAENLELFFSEAVDTYDDGDYATAFALFELVARQGHAGAQYGLGNCYFYGKGVAKNCEEAVKWYKKAAEQGHKEAIGILKQLGIN